MKNYSDLISVIVPIYNVEAYIKECIDTLINQTYQNLEIILVDDGSTDNCPNICDIYGQKDKRIKVIHKKNGGLSDARNNGLRVANGKYIVFVDSDDFVNISFIEILYETCMRNGAEMAVCKYKEITENSILDLKANVECFESKLMSGREYSINVYNGRADKLGFVAWNKIYERKLFTDNNIEYPINKYYEDTQTTFKLLYCTNKIAIIDVPLYYYRIRQGSIMTSSIDSKKIYNMIEADICPVKYYEEKRDQELFNLSLNCFLKNTINIYNIVKREDKSLKEHIIDSYIKYWKKYSKELEISIIKKIKYIYFYYMFLLLKTRGEK